MPPDTRIEHASGDREARTVFGNLAKRTGRSVDELARAAKDGTLNRIIAGPRAIARRRRAGLERTRYPS